MSLSENKIIIFIFLIYSLLFAYGCINRNKSIETEKYDVLHFDVSNWKIDKIIPEKIIKTIDFIPLETLDQCIIGSVGKIIATNDKFYILDMQNAISLSVFNKEGKFINSIGRRGRGQGEFLRLRDFCIDEIGKRLFILDSYSRKVLIYSLTKGKILKYLAVSAFLLALVVNVKVSLSDPFITMSEEAIAETTSNFVTTQFLPPKWNMHYCANLSTYEMCENGGDGLPCNMIGSRTRYCPYPGD